MQDKQDMYAHGPKVANTGLFHIGKLSSQGNRDLRDIPEG